MEHVASDVALQHIIANQLAKLIIYETVLRSECASNDKHILNTEAPYIGRLEVNAAPLSLPRTKCLVKVNVE